MKNSYKSTSNLKALLVGREYNLAWALPELLVKAGFVVDAITSSSLMQHVRFIREVEGIKREDPLLPSLLKRKGYDWIIVTEDDTLKEIKDSFLSLDQKLSLLPVLKREKFFHLFSKIGLAKLFADFKISSPSFLIATHFQEAVLCAKKLGFPVLIKRDQSCGGGGTFLCGCLEDFQKIPAWVWREKVLVQKRIEGKELDLSALFLEGNLIHFNYARQLRVRKKFGPSFLRAYRHLSGVEKEIFLELSQLGKALGAHGFVNIAAIEKEGKRFYFEADMRPNVWVSFPQFLGEDISLRIQKWFQQRQALTYPVEGKRQEMIIPYFLRLTLFEFFTNRHRVWKFIPQGGWSLYLHSLKNRILKKTFSFTILSNRSSPKNKSKKQLFRIRKSMAYALSGTEIIHEFLGDEVIIANLDAGIYYSIRNSGVLIWRYLLEGMELSSIENLFREKYEETFSFSSFVAELVEEGLLVKAPSKPFSHSSFDFPPHFSPPLLERYDEMKNLLMLDPIHEVDEEGWPSQK